MPRVTIQQGTCDLGQCGEFSISISNGQRGTRFRSDPWMEQVGHATTLDIVIRESATTHVVTLKQIESWLASTSASPHVASKKTRLKMMLMRG